VTVRVRTFLTLLVVLITPAAARAQTAAFAHDPARVAIGTTSNS
jgi:hypothetical protein